MSAATVTLCRCGHAQMRHSADDGCGNTECGCGEFRPGVHTGTPPPSLIPVAAPQPSRDVATAPVRPVVAAVRPVAPAAPVAPVAPVAALHPCPNCPRTFTSEQGLKVHKGLTHKTTPNYEAIADEIDARVTADEPAEPVAPDPTPAAAKADPTPAAPVPARTVKDSRSITVEFEAGWLEINYEVDWTKLPFTARSAVMDLTSVLFRLGHVDHFAAVIGDEGADDFIGESSTTTGDSA